MTNDDDLSHIKARHQAYVTGLEPAIANPNPPPCPVEAYPAAAAIMRDAGWKPHDQWGVYTRGTLVMGFSPDGQNFDVKNWGLDIRGPDTPDDPVEAAQWLVALRTPLVILTTEATLDPLASLPEEQQSQGHEGDGETGAEAETAAALESATDSDGFDAGGGRDERALNFDQESPDEGRIAGPLHEEVGILDADFTEDPLLEFGGEVLEEHPEEGGPQFVFGPPADDLETLRSQRIGDVVRISIAKQAAIWAESGTTQTAYQDLLNTVMRDTVQGVYIGAPEQFTAFMSQQGWANKVAAVRSKELEHVGFLTAAAPPEVHAFNPEAGWPE